MALTDPNPRDEMLKLMQRKLREGMTDDDAPIARIIDALIGPNPM